MRLHARGVNWGPGVHLLVRDVSVTAEVGQLVGIVGPNGAGKSSLLRCLAGLQHPTSGTVTYDGQDVAGLRPAERARILAFVEQNAHTDVDLTVREVVELGRIPHRKRFSRPDSKDDSIILHALREFGLEHLQQQRWATLSGGERQRAYIAKAFAQQPRVLLLDEPTNHLDVRHQFDVLHRLAQAKLTVVVALHDLAMAARYCDEVIVMQHGRALVQAPPLEALSASCIRDVFRVHARAVADGGEAHLILRRLHPEEEPF